MLKDILLVFLGGGVGSSLRFLVNQWLPKSGAILSLPYSTLFVNVIGSALVGILLGALSRHFSSTVYLLMAIGFCGGFTTFSTFSLEVVNMLKEGDVLPALAYIVLSLLLSISFGALGFYASSTVSRLF